MKKNVRVDLKNIVALLKLFVVFHGPQTGEDDNSLVTRSLRTQISLGNIRVHI